MGHNMRPSFELEEGVSLNVDILSSFMAHQSMWIVISGTAESCLQLQETCMRHFVRSSVQASQVLFTKVLMLTSDGKRRGYRT